MKKRQKLEMRFREERFSIQSQFTVTVYSRIVQSQYSVYSKRE